MHQLAECNVFFSDIDIHEEEAIFEENLRIPNGCRIAGTRSVEQSVLFQKYKYII